MEEEGGEEWGGSQRGLAGRMGLTGMLQYRGESGMRLRAGGGWGLSAQQRQEAVLERQGLQAGLEAVGEAAGFWGRRETGRDEAGGAVASPEPPLAPCLALFLSRYQ